MNFILEKIRLFLYNNELLLINTIERKVDYLKLSKINIYSDKYIFKSNLFLENNILIYIDVLKKILKRDFDKEYIYVKDITTDEFVIKDFGVWYSDNEYSLDTNIELDIFLDLSLELITRYNKISSDFIDPVHYHNSSKIKPYIINIDLIINKLVDLTIQ